MIKINPLFSGSHGNCTLVQTEKANILLDLGYGYRATLSKLIKLGIAPESISAVVISHEHGDHIAALGSWEKKYHTKVYAPKECATYIAQTCFCSDIVGVDDSFDLADVRVDIYHCSHDARGCLGYRFTDKNCSVASVTDTGVATIQMVNFLASCYKIVLESNHDAKMLQDGVYPQVLKRRIASELGHLSNGQTAAVLERLVGSNVKTVVLAHLSEKNNTKELALASATKIFARHGITVGKDIEVLVADQHENEVQL